MSIARTVLRIAAIQALTGATIAEDRVFDSTITEIDLQAASQRKPIIIVTTDDQEGSVSGRDLNGADKKLELMIEIAVTDTEQVVVDGQTQTMVVVPDTDAKIELVLDYLYEQVERALQAGGTAPWGNIFRELTPTITYITDRRGAEAKKGTRFAARQIIFSLEPLNSPVETPPAGSAYALAIAAMEANPRLTAIAQMIKGLYRGELTTYEEMRQLLGLSDSVAAKMGLGLPFEGNVAAPGITQGQFGTDRPPATSVTISQMLGNSQ